MAQLTNARTLDADGNEKSAFLPGDTIRYVASGNNPYPIPISVSLRWYQPETCGETLVYSTTLSLAPGAWQHTNYGVAPSCSGFYTSTAEITNSVQTSRLAVLDVINQPSAVVLETRQGFDICHLPSLSTMQIWWNSSPYWVFNIYLGGSMFACDDEIPDAFWVRLAAEQGWKFILTWVGPQAPCSAFREKFSSNPSTAYQQGRTEADAAIAAAKRLGFMGNRVIYYDLEGYGSSASEACRTAAAAFMRGWTTRLHDWGNPAGGYGSPTSSHIADWASNNPPPDYVWIAHWLLPYQYRPDATVWTPYLSNSLWSNHQRIRQYAGGHSETWGGATLVIDSNALDGAVTTILPPAAAQAEVVAQPATQDQETKLIASELLSPQVGWVLQGWRLLSTQDGGASWREITPQSGEAGIPLAADFLDPQRGWLIRSVRDGTWLELLRTSDGGLAWENSLVPLNSSPLGGSPPIAAWLEFRNNSHGWLALKLQSGSSFSLGRLFVTMDGGVSWQERSLPLGEAARFIDSMRGWVAGGARGDQFFRTDDGGIHWKPVALPLPDAQPGERTFIGLPEFDGAGTGYLPVTRSKQDSTTLLVFTSPDGGNTWKPATELPGVTHQESFQGVPFSLGRDGTWQAGHQTLRVQLDSALMQTIQSESTLKASLRQLEFVSSQVGWAIVEAGECSGPKTAQRCKQYSRLLATQDGGASWKEITPATHIR